MEQNDLQAPAEKRQREAAAEFISQVVRQLIAGGWADLSRNEYLRCAVFDGINGKEEDWPAPKCAKSNKNINVCLSLLYTDGSVLKVFGKPVQIIIKILRDCSMNCL